MKRLILIDDHKLLRKGISAYITEKSDWIISAEAESLSELDSVIRKINAETKASQGSSEDIIVAIVDLQLKDSPGDFSGGFQAVKILLSHGIPSVIFSSHDTGTCVERAMSAEVGARGFVSKVSDEKMLLTAIDAVADGNLFVQPDLVSAMLEKRSLFSALTKREQEVTNLIAEGLTNLQIAEKLNIKLTTLENYISIIYAKFGCKDRLELLEKLK
ncbi:MAG: response regulator transcription factor [Treponemataceae bacterium]|nr:response regulator transcription factor [Treponemataceae bacterium]